MTTAQEDKNINRTLDKLEERINNISHRPYTIQEVNNHEDNHKDMPDEELNRMAHKAALEAHGLHRASSEELDKPILVNVVPSLPVERPKVVFVGGYRGKGVIPETRKQAEKRPNTALSVPSKNPRQSTSTDQLRNAVHTDVLKNRNRPRKNRKRCPRKNTASFMEDTDNLRVRKEDKKKRLRSYRCFMYLPKRRERSKTKGS